jgi:hypothetical protein
MRLNEVVSRMTALNVFVLCVSVVRITQLFEAHRVQTVHIIVPRNCMWVREVQHTSESPPRSIRWFPSYHTGWRWLWSGRVVPTFQRSLLPPSSGRIAYTAPDYTVLQPRRQPSSYSSPWEPQILLPHRLFKWCILGHCSCFFTLSRYHFSCGLIFSKDKKETKEKINNGEKHKWEERIDRERKICRKKEIYVNGRGIPCLRNFPPSSLWSEGTHVNYPLLLSDFDQNWKVSTDFSEIPQYRISWKSVQPFSSFYMHTDGRTG